MWRAKTDDLKNLNQSTKVSDRINRIFQDEIEQAAAFSRPILKHHVNPVEK